MKKILVIDDDENIRNLFCESLKVEDIEVIEAVNGETGLAMALKEKPDLILLDLTMDKMDGHTMLEELRQDDWGKTAQVIVTSNKNDPEDIGKSFYDEGVLEYIVKANFDINSLKELVVKAVKDKTDPV